MSVRVRRAHQGSSSRRRKQVILTAALGGLAAVSGAFAADTGWNQTGAGTFDYNLSTNWVGSTLNDVFGDSLTLTSNQLITLGANRNAPGGITFGYSGDFDLTIQSTTTTDRRIVPLGDVVFDPVGTGRTLTFGSVIAADNLGGVPR